MYKKTICVLLVFAFMFLSTFPAYAAETVTNGDLYYIRNARSGKYLTATSDENICQDTLNYEERQRFFIRGGPIEGVMYYAIVSDWDTDYRVDIDGAEDKNYQNVKLFTTNSEFSDAQNFRFARNLNSAYQIMPRLSTTRVLDVENASMEAGANVQLFTKRSTDDSYVGAQQWYLESATTSLMSWDLVSLKHLDWYADDSAYASYVPQAAEVWNNYKSNVIRKDNILRTREVNIVDVENIAGAVAVTNANGTISLNTTILENYSEDQILNMMIHELGHALGMGHLNDATNVLYYANNATVTLDDNNRNSYDLAYERY